MKGRNPHAAKAAAHPEPKVVFNMTMSQDGLVAGPNDGTENGEEDGADWLFKCCLSGNTEISIGSGSPMLKVSTQGARILKEAIGTHEAGTRGR